MLRAPVADGIDEAQLLEETETLLSALHPAAFLPLLPAPLSSASSSPSRVSDDVLAITTTTTSGRRRPGRAPQPGAKRNPSRDRTQREIAELRAQAAALEQQLQTMRGASSAISRAQGTAWAAVARRQRSRRERAESENKRLKRSLEAHVAFASDFFQNWQREMATPSRPPRSVVPRDSVHFEQGDAETLETFLSELHATYLRTGAVFRDSGLSESQSPPFSSVATRTESARRGDGGVDRTFVETVGVDVSPFEFEEYKKSAFHCVRLFHVTRDAIRYQSAGDHSDSFAVKQRDLRTFNGVSVYVSYLFAMRRYETAQRELWVWRGVSRSEGDLRDLCVEETGWVVASDLAADRVFSVPGTLVQSCVQYEAMRVGGGAIREGPNPATEFLIALALSTSEDDIDEMSGMIESMALDDRIAPC